METKYWVFAIKFGATSATEMTPVVGFWIWDVCLCYFWMCVNGEGFAGMRVTVLRQSLPMLILSSWSDFMDIHLHVRWDHTLLKKRSKTLVFCSRHVNIQKIHQWSLLFLLFFLFFSPSLSLRRPSSASRRDLEVSFRAVFAEARGAQHQTS